MADLSEWSDVIVAISTGVNVQNAAGATVLYTCPPGKSFIPDKVIIRNNTASLAGGTDFDFTSWRQTVDLSGMTTTGDYRVLQSADNTTYTPIAAGGTFSVTPSTGATAAGTATFEVHGHLI